MRYSQLRAFDAVARHGSFSRAAEELGIGQPAVSIQVRALERDHRVALFDRSSRHVRLTDDGQALFRLTRDMFEAEQEIAAFLSESESLERGTLRLGSDGPHLAIGLVARCRAAFPGLEISLTLGNARTTWQALLAQQVDAAIIANPPPDERVAVEQIACQDLVALLPRPHRLAGRKTVGLAELAREAVISREAGSNTQGLVAAALAEQGLSIRPVLTLASREAVVQAVRNGLGIGFLFGNEVDPDRRAVAVRVRELRASSRDCLVYLRRRARHRSIRALSGITAAFRSGGESAAGGARLGKAGSIE